MEALQADKMRPGERLTLQDSRGGTCLTSSINANPPVVNTLNLETATEAVNRRAPARYSPHGKNPALAYVQQELSLIHI